jgi:acyl-ACP thioesterase
VTNRRPEPTELVEPPSSGRIYREALRPAIADVIGDGRDGRTRIDAIARWLQDVAYLDLIDAGFEGRGGWIVRKMRIRVESFPRFGDHVEVATFCSGIGRFCAERCTTVSGGGARVEAVALWVLIGLDNAQPMRLPEDFVAAYEESARGRRATVRLRHPDPPAGAESLEWTWRAADLDIAGHVNNSHYWGTLEEMLAGGTEPQRLDAEIEHRSAAQPGAARILSAGEDLWVTAPDGEVQASILRYG